MKPHPFLILCLAALFSLRAHAADLRLDVATDNNSGDDTAWFSSSQLVNLNFPSVNGHSIEQGNASHLSAISAQGNSLGIYYDYFHTLPPRTHILDYFLLLASLPAPPPSPPSKVFI